MQTAALILVYAVAGVVAVAWALAVVMGIAEYAKYRKVSKGLDELNSVITRK